jgi:hypothetical protein
LLFGMLGYFTPDLLLLRLKETAAGAFCGAVVASLVLVRRERTATQDATIAFLRALGQSVDSAAGVLLDGTPDPGLAACIMTAEQRFHDLSAIAQSEQAGLAASRNEPLRRLVLVLEGCEQWARELGQIALQSGRLEDAALAVTVRQAVARIHTTLSGLIDRIPNQSAIPEIADEPSGDLGRDAPDEMSHRAVRLFLRIDAALVHLASRHPSG